MKKIEYSNRLPAILVCMALCAIMVQAQGRRPGKPRPPVNAGATDHEGPRRRNPQPGLSFLSSEMRFGWRVVKGAPFTADAISESTQTLTDGTTIVRKSSARVARDSDGRTRREQQLSVIGPFNVSGDPPHLIFIDDPVAELHHVLDVKKQTATKMPIKPDSRPSPPAIQKLGEVVESLGTQVIEGVEATGTRSTVTIPVNQVGNDRPLQIVAERWESTELKVTVLSRHSDPRTGVTTYKLVNINRSEPEPSLFIVPSDYKIQDTRARPDRKIHRGGPPRGRRIPGVH